MLYLFEPNSSLKWDDTPASWATDLVEKHDADLGRLPWEQSTEMTFSIDALRVALRVGMACSRGIVVDATKLSTLGRAANLLQAFADAEEAQKKLRKQDEMMEHIMPGWLESGEKIQKELQESVAGSVEEAEQDAADLFKAPVKQALVEHWENMGGTRPNPL